MNLNKECAFWNELSVCYRPTCHVEECSKEEIPPQWIEDRKISAQNNVEDECQDIGGKEGKLWEGTAGGPVDRSIGILEKTWTKWNVKDESWIIQDDDAHMSYIDLNRNPEGYTGYGGPSAARIWSALYGENCFSSKDVCLEQRMFYKLLSGMQACVSCHIAANYPIEKKIDEIGFNLDFFKTRVGDHPDRVQNIYFSFIVLSRYEN